MFITALWSAVQNMDSVANVEKAMVLSSSFSTLQSPIYSGFGSDIHRTYSIITNNTKIMINIII